MRFLTDPRFRGKWPVCGPRRRKYTSKMNFSRSAIVLLNGRRVLSILLGSLCSAIILLFIRCFILGEIPWALAANKLARQSPYVSGGPKGVLVGQI